MEEEIEKLRAEKSLLSAIAGKLKRTAPQSTVQELLAKRKELMIERTNLLYTLDNLQQELDIEKDKVRLLAHEIECKEKLRVENAELKDQIKNMGTKFDESDALKAAQRILCNRINSISSQNEALKDALIQKDIRVDVLVGRISQMAAQVKEAEIEAKFKEDMGLPLSNAQKALLLLSRVKAANESMKQNISSLTSQFRDLKRQFLPPQEGGDSFLLETQPCPYNWEVSDRGFEMKEPVTVQIPEVQPTFNVVPVENIEPVKMAPSIKKFTFEDIVNTYDEAPGAKASVPDIQKMRFDEHNLAATSFFERTWSVINATEFDVELIMATSKKENLFEEISESLLEVTSSAELFPDMVTKIEVLSERADAVGNFHEKIMDLKRTMLQRAEMEHLKQQLEKLKSKELLRSSVSRIFM